jgi:hypothetical protein
VRREAGEERAVQVRHDEGVASRIGRGDMLLKSLDEL